MRRYDVAEDDLRARLAEHGILTPHRFDCPCNNACGTFALYGISANKSLCVATSVSLDPTEFTVVELGAGCTPADLFNVDADVLAIADLRTLYALLVSGLHDCLADELTALTAVPRLELVP